MTAPAPVVQPEGGAGGAPLPRRLGAALRTSLRSGQLIRWLGGAGAVIPALALTFIFLTLLIKGLPAIKVNGPPAYCA